ncbi:MAG: DNA polymerase III subunit delta [Clostridia bacterium]|nr:DNA polymerase III subunit delta [Clostridia bacterium]
MTFENLEKNLNAGKLDSLYLIYGEEEYLVDKLMKKIRKNFGELLPGMNYIQIDETSTKDIISNIESPAFGYEKKLIIVKNSGLFKKDGRKKQEDPLQEEIANYIKENKEIIDEMVILVFCEKEINKNIVYKAIENVGLVCECEVLKPHQIINNLKQICKMYKVDLEDSVAQYFLEIAGTSMQDLINEIRKLIEYTGENGSITKDAINNLTTKQVESIIFDLTDNLGLKKTDKAIEILDNLIYNKEPVAKILVTLYNHFKKIYYCIIGMQNNKELVSTLGLKPNQTFLVTKYKKQASYFKIEDLKKILKDLTELDYGYKIGKIDLEVGLKSILCTYC